MINDIRLKRTKGNLFDWDFGINDISNVTGINRIKSAIIHSLLLKKNELRQEYYEDKGSNLNLLLLEKKNENLLKLVVEECEYRIKQISGVANAEVSLLNSSPYEFNIKITILTDTGLEVDINGI